MLSILCSSAQAQSFLERLGERAKNAAEQNIGQKVEKGVNDVLDGNIGKKGKKEAEAAKPADPATPATEPAAQKKPVNTAYAKSDFVPGDEIFFEDNFADEQMGEFPSRWDLISGYAEVGSIEGRKIIAFTDDGSGSSWELPEITKTNGKAAAITSSWFLPAPMTKTSPAISISITEVTALPASPGAS